MNDSYSMSQQSRNIFDKWWKIKPEVPYTEPIEHRFIIMQKELIESHLPNMDEETKNRAILTLAALKEQIVTNAIINELKIRDEEQKKIRLAESKILKEQRKLELETKKLAQQEAQEHLL
jgi:hypothetical protein